ncbi:MAG: FAD-binding oxidoreductase, partial [Chloroflexi bacterium]|nr:FAD-binding oxidoreductase [Chloroflexota bacterium]
DVETETQPNLGAMFSYFEERLENSSYIVGWMDAFARGKALGRGDVHKATYLPPGADPNPSQTMRLDNQHLPPTMFGVVPKSIIWVGMRPFMNNPGTWLINSAKYRAGRIFGPTKHRQPHAAFHFLLDYVPDWKKAYGSGGLIQYQPFIPKETAQDAFREILQLCQKRRLPNYLTVFKRHRPDDFLLTHALDGYSMAMDFRIANRNRDRVVALAREMDEIVLGAGGRFYFAKDSVLRRETAVAYLGQETVDQFRALKQRCDPDNILQTNLWRRVFG